MGIKGKKRIFRNGPMRIYHVSDLPKVGRLLSIMSVTYLKLVGLLVATHHASDLLELGRHPGY